MKLVGDYTYGTKICGNGHTRHPVGRWIWTWRGCFSSWGPLWPFLTGKVVSKLGRSSLKFGKIAKWKSCPTMCKVTLTSQKCARRGSFSNGWGSLFLNTVINFTLWYYIVQSFGFVFTSCSQLMVIHYVYQQLQWTFISRFTRMYNFDIIINTTFYTISLTYTIT